jgi:ATP-dependent Clp protease ATP-binding subunit ClpC
MFEKFSDSSRKAVQVAYQQANKLKSPYLRPEHLLLGLLDAGGVCRNELKQMGVDIDGMVAKIISTKGFAVDMIQIGKPPMDMGFKKAVELAMEKARDDMSGCVHTNHLLHGILGSKSSPACEIMMEFGITERVLGDGLDEEIDCRLSEMKLLKIQWAECLNRFDRLTNEVIELRKKKFEQKEGLA